VNSACCSTKGVALRTPGLARMRAATWSASSSPWAPAWKTSRCGLAAMIRSRIASWKPVMTASTMISAATPRNTPPTPIQTNSERFVR
jgi:hypothetical protein